MAPKPKLADRLVEDVKTLARLPDLVRRIEARFPPAGGAPPELPLVPVNIVSSDVGKGWLGYALTALIAGAAGVVATLVLALTSCRANGSS